MKNKKLFARLLTLSMSLAMIITSVPVRGADNDFVSFTNHSNSALEKSTNLGEESIDTSDMEFRTHKGEKKNTALKKMQTRSAADSSFSKKDIKNGSYNVTFLDRKENQENEDQINKYALLFSDKMDVEVKGDVATIKFYVISTLKKINDVVNNLSINVDQKMYKATIDKSNKKSFTIKKNSTYLGLNEKANVEMYPMVIENFPIKALNDAIYGDNLKATAVIHAKCLIEDDEDIKEVEKNENIDIDIRINNSKYVIDNSEFSTKLEMLGEKPIFYLSFDGNEYRFSSDDYKKLLENGKISIGGSKIYSLKETGFTKTASPYYQQLICENLDFIKIFANDKTLRIVLIDQDGNVAKLNIKSNKLSDEEIEKITGKKPKIDNEEKQRQEEKKKQEKEEKQRQEEKEKQEKEEAEKKNQSNYQISTGLWSGTDFKWGNNFAIFDIAFKNQKNDKTEFNDNDKDAFLSKGKIQINNGKIWTFADAKIKSANNSKNYFESKDIEFIKEFVESKKLNIKVTDPNGKIIEAIIDNELNDEQIKKFKDNLNAEPKKEENKKQEENQTNKRIKLNIKEEDLKPSTRLLIDYKETVCGRHNYSTKFRISFQSLPQRTEGEKTRPVLPKEDEKDFAQNTEIIINGFDFGSMDSVGMPGLPTWEGANGFSLEEDALKNIKEVLNDKVLNVKLLNKTYGIIKFTIENKLTDKERTKFTGVTIPLKDVKPDDNKKEKKDENQKNDKKNLSKIKIADVEFMKSGDYNSISMSAPTVKKKAEILTTKDGKHKLILHFGTATIMNVLCWSTDLQLTGIKDKILDKTGEKGDIKTQFILMADRSAICIVDLPEIKDRVYEGHIYSNIMDKEMALKISGIKDDRDVKTALDDLIKDAKNKLSTKSYYKRLKNF